MRAIFVGVAAVVMLALVGAYVLAQEVIATPAPAGPAKINPGADVNVVPPAPLSPVASAPAGPAKDTWRYRRFDGRWWYWTPAKRWLWYNGDGQWVEFEPVPAPYAVYRPAYVYPGYYRPYYRPGVAVGVGPYGNVGVGVGRRVGVDVWGAHGAVRVGRIGVGW